MDLRQLRAFITIAETGNVTRAAEALNLVQPAVTRQLRLLEEDLGTPLFERRRHGMRLTDAGRTLLDHAQRILQEVARTRAEIRPNDGPLSGLVTVGLLASTSDLIATALFAEVKRRHPAIQLRLTVGYAGHLGEWLDKGDLDAALLYGQPLSPALHASPLLEESLWAVAPARAKLTGRRRTSLARVAREPFILPSAPQGLRAAIENGARQAGLRLNVVAETNALPVQKALVMQGHGWTILPGVSVAQEVALGQLCGSPLSAPALQRTIVLAISATRPPSKAVRATVDALTDCVHAAVQSGNWADARWVAS